MATIATLRFDGQNVQGPVEIIAAASPQTFTTSWVDLGSNVYDLTGVDTLALYLILDQNSAANMRVRLLAQHTAGGTEYVLPIATIGASDVKVEDRYEEFNDDADQSVVITWELGGVVAFGTFQISAGTAGTGQVDAAHAMTSRRM